ncbi:MoaD/ThiS family protein [Marinicella sp. S1101]|uniref:MoaD/ThiS family protein n=1 Tax=Marinicella marina TaxID=2996016 RepID=UPI002260A058|nr:MoaD/ThiS family protein [Marinicella marina]MCX7553533.1 MoaD/ThiS family protein [Marinicella marina]MDJ1140157.1 MoaD/ThiS family protein [Marinicella marina]
MKITTEFYGRLKEQFSPEPIEIESIPHPATIQTVFDLLCELHQVKINPESIKPILNDTFADWDDEVKQHDIVGFFPPAAGG